MSTYNICFCREIRKLLCGYLVLSVAMSFFSRKLSATILSEVLRVNTVF